MNDPVAMVLALPADRRQIVALAGPPGSGKSTLAENLRAAARSAGRSAAVVPMDGFHLDNGLLERRGLLSRKGAPETFDLDGFAALVSRLVQGGTVIHPVFDRDRDIAIAGAAEVVAECDLVIVEGNYLLLDAPGWRTLSAHWDLSIHLAPPRAVLRERLVARWTGQGLDRVAAEARCDGNDMRNADLVCRKALPADLYLDV